MKSNFFNFLPLILLFTIPNILYSQSWRFPDCNDLSVTNMEFIDTQHDTLLVSVSNECDTCIQHVYTGLIAYQNQDTLAIDRELFSRPSPPNNSELDYYLIAQNNFEISNIDKIKMVAGICDSLPFSSILNADESSIENINPNSYSLFQNYPNPFNPITNINYSLMEKGVINISVYDITGRKIKTLVSKNQNKGEYSVSFDGSNLGSGVYFYKLESGSFNQSRKMILLR